jgi:nicotinamidase-related amidase
MNWKKRHRSFYYKYAEDPDDIVLKPEETAHLIIDVQKTYLEPKPNTEENVEWQPFFNRMNDLVIPNIKNLISFLRNKNIFNIFVS